MSYIDDIAEIAYNYVVLSAWMKNWKCQNRVAVGHYGIFLARQSKILSILYGTS